VYVGMTNRPTVFVLYLCESWYFTLRTEHKLQVFEKNWQGKWVTSKRDEVIKQCMISYDEGL
jgi:hypothetical protein